MTTFKSAIKNFLGELPLTAELYWQFRQRGKPTGGFSFKQLQDALPIWKAQANAARQNARPGKRVWLVGALRYWLEHETLLGLALAGLGHQVTLAFFPYANWQKPIETFDLRRQNACVLDTLSAASPLVQPVSWMYLRKYAAELPAQLQQAVERIALQDTQYTLQIEDVDPNSKLYQRRLERNLHAARVAWDWWRANAHRPDVVIIPNGSILEFGAVYQVCRYLQIPVTTYEFGEQRERIWFAHNDEVMRQDTTELWQTWKDIPLTEAQWHDVRQLFAARQKASLWENFSRRWQGVPGEGGEKVRAALNLDARPVALLAANVIGDSLTLGRQIFSESMTQWLTRTVQAFAARPQTQLVVRIHPGERYTQGPSVADVVRRALPELPSHIHLVAADAPINTYDLIEIADVGLVYTTTVGLEMAMSGVPALIAGDTHYRSKGFTYDPPTWDAYFGILDKILAAPVEKRLAQPQVERAWMYAYRFFFDYPMPFPWHLLHFWKDVAEWQVERVLSPEGMARYAETFAALTGVPRIWHDGGVR